MDMQGNIYDLAGNFIGTTDGDGGAEGAMMQQQDDMDGAHGDDMGDMDGDDGLME